MPGASNVEAIMLRHSTLHRVIVRHQIGGE